MVPRARPRPGPDAAGTLIIYAISVTGILGNTLVAPALPDIARDLDVSKGGIGLVVAAASLPGVVVAPVIGVAADRIGRRAVVIPCLVTFGVGALASMVAGSFTVLLASRLLQGFGAAGLVNLAVVMMGDRYEDPAERAEAIGRNGAVLTIGLAVLPALGGALTALAGWRASFAPCAVAFVVAVAAARYLPAGRPPQAQSLGEQLRGAGHYLRDRRVVAMNVAGLLGFVLIFGLVLTALPIDLDERFGTGPAMRGVVLGVSALAAAVVSLSMGRLARRFPTWDLVLAGFAIFAVSFVGVAAAPTVGLVTAAVVVYGVGEGLIIVTLQAYAAGLAPAAFRGVMVAIWVAAARGGQALGPILAGLSLHAVGPRGSFVAGAILSAVVALAVFVTRRSLTLPAISGGSPGPPGDRAPKIA
jgi:MFS family permease